MFFPIYIKEKTNNLFCAGSFDLESCETCGATIDLAISELKKAIKHRLIEQITINKQPFLYTQSLSYYQKTKLQDLDDGQSRILTTVLDIKLDDF